MNRSATMAALVLALVAFLVHGTAGAENYPERPVRIIVPIGPGGSYDFVGRLLANRLTELMGQTFFVENRTGAGTLVGTQSAAVAPPDGYTLLIGGLSNIVFNFALYQKVGYEVADFVPIALVYTFPYVLVARSDLPQKDLAEIISYGRQSPGKLTMAHAGTGSGQQIVGAAFMRRTGTTMIEVPYRTIRGAYVDMLAGRVDLMFDSAAAALPYVAAKKVRGIALLAPERYRSVPDLPTIAEAGLAGLGIESWIGLFAPAGTPADVLDKLRSTTRVAAEDLKAQFESSGGGLMQMPVADTDKFIKSEFELWTRLIRDAGIHLD
ncbi:MAG: tripartite tricarboxylate transporter substrate binding protein [Xanthobacteraceae bacterium]|nr:tripartite tricarboxylate transporter substrate binding protein [Xanthobacteraceae bacterium]